MRNAKHLLSEEIAQLPRLCLSAGRVMCDCKIK